MDPDGSRYRLLETVRQYAQERLVAAGEGGDARTRHLAFYLALAEQARPGLAGPDQRAWLAQLDLERENLLSAHAWCDHAQGGAEAGLRLAFAIKPYWLHRGLLAVGYQVTTEALARTGAQLRSPARCSGLANAGQLGFYLGRYAEAQRLLEQSLEIAREIGDNRRIAAVLQPLGMVCLGRGDVAAARRHLTEALAMARELGNKRELAAALIALGQLHRMEGELDAAEPIYDDALTIARELGDRDVIAIGLLNLAMVSIGRGAKAPARAMLLEVLAIAEEVGSKPAAQSVFEVSAGLAASCGDWAGTARFFGNAEVLSVQTGLRRDPTDEAFLAPFIAAAQAALGAQPFAAAEALGRAEGYDKAVPNVRAWLLQPP